MTNRLGRKYLERKRTVLKDQQKEPQSGCNISAYAIGRYADAAVKIGSKERDKT
jgi:hypothetical protein